MLPPFSIADVLASFTQPLSLSWHNKNQPSPPERIDLVLFQNWTGLLHPDRYHAIEVIDRNNIAQLNVWLLQNKPATTWVVCDDEPVPSILQQHSQSRPVNILQTPLSSTQIIHTLSYHLANNYCVHKHEHGVFIKVFELGILLKGKSGMGKSSLALELIERQHPLIADDAPLFYQYPGSHSISGISPPLLLDFLQVADLGVLNVKKLFGPSATTITNALHLIIDLVDKEQIIQLQPVSAIHNHTKILGVDIPVIKLFAQPQRNLATMVETAVKNHILYRDGYDANQVLTEKLQQELKDTTK